MSFLNLENKTILVFGVANKRSVAYHVARVLEGEGATVVYGVQTPEHRDALAGLLEGREVHVCDVRHEPRIAALVEAIRARHPKIHGLVHSQPPRDQRGTGGLKRGFRGRARRVAQLVPDGPLGGYLLGAGLLVTRRKSPPVSL